MYQVARSISLFLVSGSLAACAVTPNIIETYYLPKTEVTFRVIRTVGCDANDHPIVANSATVTPVHLADYNKKRTLEIKRLDGFFANSDIKVEYFDDGRLKSVNATTTGQGEAIIKSAISLAGAIMAFDGSSPRFPAQCKFIKDQGKDKPLTPTFEGTLSGKANGLTLTPDDSSLFYFRPGPSSGNLQAVLGNASVSLNGEPAVPAPPQLMPDSVSHHQGYDVNLHLRQPAQMPFIVKAGPNGDQDIWHGRVTVAQYGIEYDLPIPSAALFGKQGFAVAFGESGAITSLQYVKETGAVAVVNVGSALAAAAAGDSPSKKAADLKAEADIIAQQQRLVRCTANPKGCT